MLSSMYNPNHQPLDPRCEALDVLPVFEGLGRGSSFDHLLACQLSAELVMILFTYIRTFLSSPAEANMHGLAGFQETELQHPFGWPSSFSTMVPFSLWYIKTFPTNRCNTLAAKSDQR
jgi:hypothetical protein